MQVLVPGVGFNLLIASPFPFSSLWIYVIYCIVTQMHKCFTAQWLPLVLALLLIFGC